MLYCYHALLFKLSHNTIISHSHPLTSRLLKLSGDMHPSYFRLKWSQNQFEVSMIRHVSPMHPIGWTAHRITIHTPLSPSLSRNTVSCFYSWQRHWHSLLLHHLTIHTPTSIYTVTHLHFSYPPLSFPSPILTVVRSSFSDKMHNEFISMEHEHNSSRGQY